MSADACVFVLDACGAALVWEDTWVTIDNDVILLAGGVTSRHFTRITEKERHHGFQHTSVRESAGG